MDRRPGEVRRELEEHRGQLGESLGELRGEVMEKIGAGRRALTFVPDKIRQAGGAGKRAGSRALQFARERPLVAGAIGVGAVGAVAATVMMLRRRNHAGGQVRVQDERGETRGGNGSRREQATAPARSRKRRARR